MVLKIDQEERKVLREARNEWHIVIKRAREIGFNYILFVSKPAKIAFGTSIERDCLPTEGPAKSSLMRRLVPESREFPGPSDYHVSYSLPSKKGYTGLSNRSPRFSHTNLHTNSPGVGLYTLVRTKTLKSNAKPFNVGAKARI